jgi:hypothetical protein
MKGTGIQLGSDYDLLIRAVKDETGKIASGLCIGDTLAQNQALILLCQKGEVKNDPLLGAGINDVCNDHDFRLWKQEITQQMERDGQRISRMEVNENGLKLEAKYR